MFLLIELNEFNADFLLENSKKYNLLNIKELLSFNHCYTIAKEKEERYGLDPWVQWVSIHTGLPAEEHKIWHLGDTSSLNNIQIWEKLSSLGYKTGIWGPMNSRQGNLSNNLFYFPDPWSFNESAYPKKLNSFLSLPRYYSKNYEKLQIHKLFNKSLLFIFSIFSELKLLDIFKILRSSIEVFWLNGFKNSSLFIIFDYINSFYFKKYCNKYNPEFKLIFLNFIAHFQHHDWTNSTSTNSINSVKICMVMLDKILGNILLTCNNNSTILLTNAFRQVNSFNENKYLYRQIDPFSFLCELEIKFLKLEQGMTNDGLIYFANDFELKNALDIISSVMINEKNAFQAERITKDPLALFYQFIIWDDLCDDTIINLNLNNKKLVFYKHFTKITKRSGKHVPEGDIFINRPISRIHINNYEIFDIISKFFEEK